MKLIFTKILVQKIKSNCTSKKAEVNGIGATFKQWNKVAYIAPISVYVELSSH